MLPHSAGTGAGELDLEWIDEQADRFENAWKSGPPPQIADFIGDASGPRREALLRELVKLDLEYRWKRGERQALDPYLHQFPELASSESFQRELLGFARQLGERFGESSTVHDHGGPTPPPRQTPTAIGKYVVVSELDRGGQGAVYRGIHPLLGKDVVIKVSHEALPAELADRSRLQAEGRILAELDHPNLARVYDFDFYHDQPFLVMEYVRGRTLEQYAAQERPTPRRAAALLARVARAVGVAHRRGIIHQDLKPKNILMDECGQPRVIDFGLARLRHAWSEDPNRPGVICGTPHYMAPEQARGDTTRVDQRSDLFALGAVLYFLLTGKAPFTGPNADAALERAQQCDIDRQELRRAHVPWRLERICLRAMAEDPARRPATAEELARELERYARWPRFWASVAGGTVALALVGGGIAWSRMHPPAPAITAAPEGSLMVRVNRPGAGWKSALDELPALMPLGRKDTLKIRAEIREPYYLSLFVVDGAGNIELEEQVGPEGQETSLVFPKAGTAAPLRGPAGTYLLLVCGNRKGFVNPEEVIRAWKAGLHWPMLPQGLVMHLSARGVERKGEEKREVFGQAEAQPDPEEEVRARLDSLRRELAGSCDYVEGIALPFSR